MKFVELMLFLTQVACWMVPVQAQPLFSYSESIESMVANADHVFIGKLQKFDRTEHGDVEPFYNATVTVEERLKAPDPLVEPHPAVQVGLPYQAKVLTDWQQRASRLLVASDWDNKRNNLVIDLDPNKLAALTADAKLVRDPQAVIEIAKAAIRNMPANVKRIHTFRLALSRPDVVGTGWERYYDTGGHHLLSVPVDKRLEARARDQVRSQSPFKRSEGAQALRYFKSDKNIELLRQLLDDPYVQAEHTEKMRYYSVRHSAYNTFRIWGVAVKKPVIYAAVEKSAR